ncbi:OadG family protein [Fusobacterium simiae]|uniref:OadG family protein n=1 Tax=Fusobacterium simiae TaxID=855 RepID=A0ABT4DNI5_FUSSI|nr:MULTISPECIES: OadG family protein [Fusobacterium]MCY7008926.1 OadG family protein [Fusobacterium simiae]
MWTSNTMTFWESIVTFLIGFSIVFAALIALALFILISSKVINLLVKDEVPEQKPTVSNVNANANTVTKVVAKEDNQEEVERLAVIISAISEEMREPVEKFSIVSITEI